MRTFVFTLASSLLVRMGFDGLGIGILGKRNIFAIAFSVQNFGVFRPKTSIAPWCVICNPRKLGETCPEKWTVRCRGSRVGWQ
jgi:hypothetical protein